MSATVLAEIEKERKRQDVLWGGPSHDDRHALADWAHFINGRVGALAGAGNPEARRDLIEIAALAVAAIESLDRKAKANPPKPTLKAETDGTSVWSEGRANQDEFRRMAGVLIRHLTERMEAGG